MDYRWDCPSCGATSSSSLEIETIYQASAWVQTGRIERTQPQSPDDQDRVESTIIEGTIDEVEVSHPALAGRDLLELQQLIPDPNLGFGAITFTIQDVARALGAITSTAQDVVRETSVAPSITVVEGTAVEAEELQELELTSTGTLNLETHHSAPMTLIYNTSGGPIDVATWKKVPEEELQANTRRMGTVPSVLPCTSCGATWHLDESEIARRDLAQEMVISYSRTARMDLLRE